MGDRYDIERRIGELAAAQHGVVARPQLLEIGLGAKAVSHRARNGRLRALYRGVYALGHAELRPEGHRLAAVLACGDEAALSHRTAARHWGLRGGGAGRLDVVVPTVSNRSPHPSCIRVHRYMALRCEEVTVHDRVPVTTPARTLL